MTKYYLQSLLLVLLLAGTTSAAEPVGISFELGRALLQDGDSANASIEFQRAALAAPDTQADLWMHAAYAAIINDNAPRAERLLRHAEATGSANDENLALLYAETALLKGDLDSELYFLDLLRERSDSHRDRRTYAELRSASTLFHMCSPEQAASRLRTLDNTTEQLEFLADYQRGHDKHPTIGGLLGLLPGAGYWYSGEIANGLRSLILNGVFIAAMVYSAEEEQWGAFTLLTFFEITWYSGSIYGGIDAAHRHNRDRFNACADGISPPAIEIDRALPIPTFGIKVQL